MIKNLHHDVYSGIVLLAVSILFFTKTSGLPEKAAVYPYFILSILGLFSVLIIVNGVRKTKTLTKGKEVSAEEEEERITFSLIKSPLLVLLIISLYIVLTGTLGFFVSTILFLIALLYYLKVKSIKSYLFTVIGTNLFIYLLFVKLLKVSLPQGIFF